MTTLKAIAKLEYDLEQARKRADQDRALILSAAVAAVLLLVMLLAVGLDLDSRLRRVERTTDALAGSYPDGQFCREGR